MPLTKKPAGDATGVKGQPHSWGTGDRYNHWHTLSPDNGGNSGSGYWSNSTFTLQLRGPFSCGVQAGSHRFPLSGLPSRGLLALFIVFFELVLLDYKASSKFVKRHF
jgi:hypothetical protein